MLQFSVSARDLLCKRGRNRNMVSATLDIPRAQSAAPKARRNERQRVSQAKAAPSQETLWMIAVRDHHDKAAFAALFDHFAPRLKGFVMRNGTSAAQAEEIVQDVMLTLWRKAHMFDPHRAQVSAWVYQIVRNRQIDVARKENRPMPEALKEQPEAEPDATQIVAIEQETGQLRAALAKLRPEQREVIEKAYLGELTHQEISTQTGLPLGTIKSRIRLGLQRLRHELKDLSE